MASGVWSATLFNTPASHPYALVTTSPSRQAFHNGGEFSYLAPIDGHASDPRTLRALEHNLTDLSSLSIVASAVSDPPHYAALLDRSGVIHLVQLDRDERGYGIAVQGQPFRLPIMLTIPRGGTAVAPTCIRFYWADEKLWLAAVDPSGRVIRMRFDQAEETVPGGTPALDEAMSSESETAMLDMPVAAQSAPSDSTSSAS